MNELHRQHILTSFTNAINVYDFSGLSRHRHNHIYGSLLSQQKFNN